MWVRKDPLEVFSVYGSKVITTFLSSVKETDFESVCAYITFSNTLIHTLLFHLADHP